MRWIQNTKGKPDAMLTLSIGAALLVSLKVLFGGTDLTIGANHFVFTQLDAASIAAILTPTLGAYVARKHSDRAEPTPLPTTPSPSSEPSGSGQ